MGQGKKRCQILSVQCQKKVRGNRVPARSWQTGAHDTPRTSTRRKFFAVAQGGGKKGGGGARIKNGTGDRKKFKKDETLVAI